MQAAHQNNGRQSKGGWPRTATITEELQCWPSSVIHTAPIISTQDLCSYSEFFSSPKKRSTDTEFPSGITATTMLRIFSRRIPSLLRPCSSHSISYAVSQNLRPCTNVERHDFLQRDRVRSSPNLELLPLPRAWQSSFARGFGHDLSHGGDLPATVVALKNPSNQITYDESCMDRHPPGDPSKRAFTYFIITFGRFFLAAGLRLFMCKVILSMSASKDVLAMASLEMDVGNIDPGNTVTVKWRGKPVFVRNRTEDDIKLANSVNMSELRDPQTDADRASNPTYLIVVGVCTHLGCVPLPGAGDYGGWFCPCHGSHYDISGRIRKGPAPRNLEVPEYKWLDDTKVVIG